MTRRDFELIAEVISEEPDAKYRTDLAFRFADRLCHTNPNFQRSRFLRACGAVLAPRSS